MAMPRPPLLAALLLLTAASAARSDDFGQATIDWSAVNKRRGESHDAAAPSAPAAGAPAAKPADPGEAQCPAEPPPSRYDGPRRGMGIATTDPKRKRPPRLTQTPQDAQEIVSLLSPTWYYDWNVPPVPGLSLQFVPLVETPQQGVAAAETARAMGSPAVLGYNEPDLPWGTVKDKTTKKVEVAAALAPDGWPAMAAQVPPTIGIGSPAVGVGVNGKDGWMDQFMAGRPRVDFVAVHWYGPANVEAFKAAVKKVYRAYCRPIWITEFGVYGWKTNAVNAADAAKLQDEYGLPIQPPNAPPVENPYTIAQTEDFLRGALAWLDSGEGKRYVQRYAWDPPPVPLPPTNATNALWYKDASGRVRLTELGRIYAR